MNVSILWTFGGLLLLSEVAWIFLWATIVNEGIRDGNPADVAAGFNMLSSPHSGLILFIAASFRDLNNNCKDLACSLEQPEYAWYLIPLVCFPYDILQLQSSLKLGAHTRVVSASAFTVADSVLVFVWSALVCWFAAFRAGAPSKLEGEQNQKKLRF